MLLLYDNITRDQSDCSHIIEGGHKIIAWIVFSLKSKHQHPNHSTSNRILIVFLPFLVWSFDCRQWEDLTQVWLCLLFIWDQNYLPSFLPLLSFYDASRNDAKSTCWYKNRLHIFFTVRPVFSTPGPPVTLVLNCSKCSNCSMTLTKFTWFRDTFRGGERTTWGMS